MCIVYGPAHGRRRGLSVNSFRIPVSQEISSLVPDSQPRAPPTRVISRERDRDIRARAYAVWFVRFLLRRLSPPSQAGCPVRDIIREVGSDKEGVSGKEYEMSYTELDDGDVSDEEVCSLLESSLREITEDDAMTETTYVVR